MTERGDVSTRGLPPPSFLSAESTEIKGDAKPLDSKEAMNLGIKLKSEAELNCRRKAVDENGTTSLIAGNLLGAVILASLLGMLL